MLLVQSLVTNVDGGVSISCLELLTQFKEAIFDVFLQASWQHPRLFDKFGVTRVAPSRRHRVVRRMRVPTALHAREERLLRLILHKQLRRQ